MSKIGVSLMGSARLFFSELRASLPLMLSLMLFGLFDFTQRVLPETGFDEAFEGFLEGPKVTHSGPLTDDYFQHYSQRLDDLTEKSIEGEKLALEGLPEAKITADEIIVDRNELQLLGIFKDDNFFAVIRYFVDDEGGYRVRKVTPGEKLMEFTVKSISRREVTLVGGEEETKFLRLFDLHLSDKI